MKPRRKPFRVLTFKQLVAKQSITRPDYWDCECEHFYIHPRRQHHCRVCGTWRVNQPDSRKNEVERYLRDGYIL